MLSNFVFDQTTPSSTWTVAHNLGARVVLDVTTTNNGVVQKVLPYSVVQQDVNTLIISFSAPRTGSARVFTMSPAE